MMSIDDDFIDRVLDGNTSDEEAAELQTWLQNPANLQRFAFRAELHSELRRTLRRRDIQNSAFPLDGRDRIGVAVSQKEERPSLPARTRQWLTLTAVGLATAACILFAFTRPGADRNEDLLNGVVASVVRNVSGAVQRNGARWNEPQLIAGDYDLQQGLLHLEFGGGVMVYIEAPARFDAISHERLILHSGRLSARVPPEGIGFTVQTPEAEVVDFGTEFSVDVLDGASEVHVFDGLVRINPGKRSHGDSATPLDLQASHAVRISGGQTEPEDISIAADRFIRDFDEVARNYAPAIRKKSPLVFYRMPIRDRGLVSEPPEYSGIVLTGKGKRPPHARGVFVGGSLRVGVDSIGRGGRVDAPPALNTGRFSLTLFVYRESDANGSTAVSNMNADLGNFDLSLDELGRLQGTIKSLDGSESTVEGVSVLPLNQWRHVVLTVDGHYIHLYEDGILVASKPCAAAAASQSDPIWFGIDANGTQRWDGRIDEVALFDRALDDEEVLSLYRLAQEEINRSK